MDVVVIMDVIDCRGDRKILAYLLPLYSRGLLVGARLSSPRPPLQRSTDTDGLWL